MLIGFLPFLPAIASGIGKLFGGGRGGKILDAAGAIAPVLGGAAGARAQGRMQEENAALGRDRLSLQRWQLEQALPQQRLRQSLLGSVTANAQPFRFGQMTPGMGLRGERPGSTGGMSAALISPEVRQQAQAMIQQNLANQLSGRGGPPPITGAPKSGAIDKILGIGSFASGVLGGLDRSGILNRTPKMRTGVPVSQKPWEVTF